MSFPSTRFTTEEIVSSIMIGIGASLFEAWPFCAEGVPELHQRFTPGQLVTIELLLGRLEDLENEEFPEYQMSSDVTGESYLKPEDTSLSTKHKMMSVHNRIGTYLSIGFRAHTGLDIWFKLGLMLGRHISTLSEADWAKVESTYREVFERYCDPLEYLSTVFLKASVQLNFLSDNWKKCEGLIQKFADFLNKENPGLACEQSIVSAANRKFPSLSVEEIFIIRSLASLGRERPNDRFTARTLLEDLHQRFGKALPASWKLPSDEDSPPSQFKELLSEMREKEIIESLTKGKRGYRLQHWS